jgi:hypothetical protein
MQRRQEQKVDLIPYLFGGNPAHEVNTVMKGALPHEID